MSSYRVVETSHASWLDITKPKCFINTNLAKILFLWCRMQDYVNIEKLFVCVFIYLSAMCNFC